MKQKVNQIGKVIGRSLLTKILTIGTLTAFVGFTLMFGSCQKNAEEAPSPDDGKISGLAGIKIVNGVLAFENEDELLNVAKIVGDMSASEYNLWQNNLKFSSQFSSFNEIISQNTIDFGKLERYSPVFRNGENGGLEMNNVNTNYSKITNKNGLVIIGDSTYQFSAKAIRSIQGYDENKWKLLLISQDSELKDLGIKQSKVTELFVPQANARVAPWEKFQKGNELTDIDGKDGAFFIEARLKAVTYSISWTSNRQSIDLTASFYRKNFEQKLYIPQKIEATWSFQVFDAPCGICTPTLITKTGTYVESGVSSIAKTIYDAPSYINVTNMNLPVSGSAYNGSGDMKTSTTTFLFTD